MITFTANIRSASAATDDAITTSSVGIPVTLDLSADFDGLAKTLCFKTPSAAVDIALVGDATESTVPPDVLVRSGEWLNIGIYAADANGDIVIPTVWANAGVIQLGTLPSGVDPSAPTPSWVAQVQQMAGDALNNSEQAIDTANEAKEAAITAQDSAQASAAAAAQSATEAASAEMAAANSASDAAASATTAAGSAQTATEKASEAAASAAAAGTASATATEKAGEAAQSAESAAQSATTAQESAQAAQSAQAAAAGSASTASQKASEAAQSATQAGNSASAASASATAAQTAQTAAETAQAAAETAQAAAEQAADDAAEYADRLINVYPTDTAGGSIATFADGADDVPVKSMAVDIMPVQPGTGDPSPENVRPISGWNAVEISSTSINIWDEQWENGHYSGTTGLPSDHQQKVRNKNPISVLPNTTYFIATPLSGTNVFLYDQNMNYVLQRTLEVSQGRTFTTPANAYFMNFSTFGSTYTTYNHDISINYPATDTEYHAYQGNEYTIQLGQTVYGGTLDVVNGKMTVDRAMVDLGTLTWGIAGTDRDLYSSTGLNGIIKPAAWSSEIVDAICSTYTAQIGSLVYQKRYDSSFGSDGNGRLYIYDSTKVGFSVTDFKTAMSGVQLCYKLATPFELTLTPEQISTLQGTNNVWSDAGDVEVTYRADVGLYVNKKTAQTLTAAASMLSNVETSMTATRAYAVNDFLSVNGQLYRVTAAIANGATITPGTNVTETTVGAQITALLNA